MLLSIIPSVLLSWALIPDALSGSLMDIISGKILASDLPYDYKIYDFLVMYNHNGSKVLELSAGMIIDPLTIFMLVIITTVGSLILIYSIEYMNHESDSEYGRYWTWMLLFISAMTLLVSADNLIILFFAWELVGLCSWQLIAFWNSSTKPSPDPRFKTEGEYNAHCGLKAFIMTSLGDVFFLIAIALTAWSTFEATGKFEFNILKLGEDVSWLVQLGNAGLLTITTVFFFLGAVGKSAQFPLHEWLPEAMAGPSPVSALIHAATMVKAGVYLVARMNPIFFKGMTTHPNLQADLGIYFLIVAAIGGFTAFLAATQAMVAKEIKKVLAYSTISQIGYMMAVLGAIGLISSEQVAEAYFSGLYHLMSHAVFKALLFLAAGVIIHQIGIKTMDKMGGLRSNMPKTFVILTIGAASLAAIPPLSGFYSKEHILNVFIESEQWWLFVIAAITAMLTVFYSFRMIGLVFFGTKSEEIVQIEKSSPSKVQDPSLMMIGPLGILAILVVLLGPLGAFSQDLLNHAALLDTNHTVDYVGFILGPFLNLEFLLSLVIIIVGFIPAYYLYIKRSITPESVVESNPMLRGIYHFLWNRWYLDRLYYLLFVDLVRHVSEKLRAIQTGRLSVNMNYSVLGLLVIILIGGIYVILLGGA